MHGERRLCGNGTANALSMNLDWFEVPPSGGWNYLDRLKPELQAVSRFKV